ncbi:MAG TPA: phospho-sugar mutase [Gemmataceae bacterium]|jgi:phosphoglucomutase/phosphomannomutase
MELLAQVAEGFRGIEADTVLKDQALKFLRQWLTEAEFASYRPQLHWLIESKQWPGLLDRFYQILPFGTGGRRGAVGIGPNRMNAWTLRASVQGHCEYLKEQFPGIEPLRVVLAYDVRQFEDQRHQYNAKLPNPALHLSSRDLAREAACVYVANGIHAFMLPPDSKHYLATPELSFTIRFLKAHGGLNISASHNPPDDNGGKFYDERGGQPVPPDDQIMADLVDQVTAIKALPWKEAQRCGRLHWLDEKPHRAYLDLCRKTSLVPPPQRDDFKIVFTPLHGVGALTAMKTLVEQGFHVLPVAEQMTPDGQFPNVTKSPNPEVPESMDRAALQAQEHKADLVLATDPDADRLGAMAPDKAEAWHTISGNQMAALLTHFKLNKLTHQGRLPSSPIIVRTEVTTSLVTRIARHFKAQIIDDLLVGFKYIADVLWCLEREGSYGDVTGTPEDFVLAVEESHGVLVTPHIRDKDAAGAALLMAELTLDQKRRQQTVVDYLERLFREFGYFQNEGVSVFMRGLEGKQQMARMMDRLRATPPRSIASLDVTAFEDLRDENGRFGPIKGATDAASRNVLVFRCGDRARIVLRPSGTEPKAKMYLETSSPPRQPSMSDDAWLRQCREADELMKRMAVDFKQQALQLIGLDPLAAG